MKCPKCGYLGFEAAERCRNCGYEFSLTSASPAPDLRLRSTDRDEVSHADDLDLIDAAAQPRASTAIATLTSPGVAAEALPVDAESRLRVEDLRELPLFAGDAPLITKASPPRPPLAVRRATPEVPGLRAEPGRTPPLSFHEGELEMPLEAPITPAARATHEWTPEAADSPETAGLGRRFLASGVDLALLLTVDLVVIYFTLQICGLSPSELDRLPMGPLIVFLLVQNGGYLVAFTVGGQTIGKMLTGIRVVTTEVDAPMDLGRSIQRTFVWSLLALPAGLGLLTALLSPERQGLHDRFARTRVVRDVAS